MKRDAAFMEALTTYAMKIKKDGFAAGEDLIQRYEKRWTDFRPFAYAAGTMLRAEELLAADRQVNGS